MMGCGSTSCGTNQANFIGRSRNVGCSNVLTRDTGFINGCAASGSWALTRPFLIALQEPSIQPMPRLLLRAIGAPGRDPEDLTIVVVTGRGQHQTREQSERRV